MSPIFAFSTCSLSLNIALVFLDFIIDVFTSLLSSPFAIALLFMNPFVSTVSPFSSTIVWFTVTVNSTVFVSPAGIDITHFTPTISFPSVIVVPSLLIDANVVFAGILSVTSIFSTSFLLLFVTFIVYLICSPAYTRFSPASVVADFSTTISGFSALMFAVVDATTTLIGFHQSQNFLATTFSSPSSTLVIVVSPTSFTFVPVVTPLFVVPLFPVVCVLFAVLLFSLFLFVLLFVALLFVV